MCVCVCVCLRDTWDPFQLNPIGAEKEQKRRCFEVAQYLVAVIVGLAVLTSAVVAKVWLSSYLSINLSINLLLKIFIFLFIIGVEEQREKHHH